MIVTALSSILNTTWEIKPLEPSQRLAVKVSKKDLTECEQCATLLLLEETMTDAVEAKPIDRLRDLNIGARQEAYPIDPRLIVVEQGFNPRYFSLPANREHLDILKDSIVAMNGVQQPLWVRWDNANKIPYLIDGECRLKAVLELIAEGHEIVSVPVIQKSKSVGSVADRLFLALTANEGLHLSQLEVGATYMRLEGFGHTVEAIAKRAGKSERYVRDAIALADAPEPVKALVASGDVSQAEALRVVKQSAGDGDKAAATLEASVKQNKADGKGQVKAPKADKKVSKLKEIGAVISEYENTEPKDLTKDLLIRWMADISDIMDAD
jgi:ParB-like chromosome segregation protein Spo0J